MSYRPARRFHWQNCAQPTRRGSIPCCNCWLDSRWSRRWWSWCFYGAMVRWMEAIRRKWKNARMTIPKKWREQFPTALIEPQTIGESGADVFRLRCGNGEDLFLKSEPIGPLAELPDEIERLRWLRQWNLPGPAVLDVLTENQRHWLLMSAVPGQDLASASDLSAPQVIRLV